jgi:hypothetical protein
MNEPFLFVVGFISDVITFHIFVTTRSLEQFVYEYPFPIFSAELKMEVLREREMRETLERRLIDEQRLRGGFNRLVMDKLQNPRPIYKQRATRGRLYFFNF